VGLAMTVDATVEVVPNVEWLPVVVLMADLVVE